MQVSVPLRSQQEANVHKANTDHLQLPAYAYRKKALTTRPRTLTMATVFSRRYWRVVVVPLTQFLHQNQRVLVCQA